MSTGVKVVLIGCVVLLLAGIITVGLGFHLFKQWFSKAQTEANEYSTKTAHLSKEYPFTPPDNGIITESQLQRFLAVRKSMYGIYKQYEAELKKLSEGDQAFRGALKGIKVWKEVRMAHVNALESQKMSPEEYSFVVTSVYKTWAAQGAKKALKHETVARETEARLKESIAAVDKQIADPTTPEDAKKALQQTKEALEKQLQGLPQSEVVQQLDEELQAVPKENIELFTKYQKEIEQYSMAGLEFIGL